MRSIRFGVYEGTFAQENAMAVDCPLYVGSWVPEIQTGRTGKAAAS